MDLYFKVKTIYLIIGLVALALWFVIALFEAFK